MIGTVLAGRYRVDRLLGRGGMGSVYEGTHMELSRKVAIKLLADADDAPADAIAATEREARAAAQLAHPHIVQVTDFSSGEGGPPFLVMELLQGESLAERLARVGRLSSDAAVFIAVQVLSALAAAHDAGLVHRDVKPANIFLARTAATHEFVKLLDFGVAWNMGPVSTRGRADAGTPAFMAPEQVRGEKLDARTDIWAMGVCLYEMLTNQRPFGGSSSSELLWSITDRPPPPVSTLVDEIDPDLERVVTRALEKRPTRRFQSAEEMRAALAPFARAAAVPSRAIDGREAPVDGGGATVTATVEWNETLALQSTVRDPGTTVSVPSRSAPPIADAPATPLPKPQGAAPADPRPRRAVTLLAGGVVVVAAAGVGLAMQARRPHHDVDAGPAAAAAPALHGCRIAHAFAPWDVGNGPVDITANETAVVISADTPAGPPRFAFAEGTATALTEWSDPRLVASSFAPAEHALSCTGLGLGEIVGAAVQNRGPRATFLLAHVARSVPRVGTMASASSFAHHSTLLKCAHSTEVTLFASYGDDALMFEGVLVPDQLRLVAIGLDGPPVSAPFGVARLIDYAIAVRGNTVAIAISREPDLLLGVTTLTKLQPFVSPVEPHPVQQPTVAVAKDHIAIAWTSPTKPGVGWARYDLVGGPETRGGRALDGDVLMPTLAAHRDGLMLAYGKRDPNGVTIFVGVGSTLPEAAGAARAVATASDVTQLRLASGASPWLAWVERAKKPDAAPVAHLSALDCPP